MLYSSARETEFKIYVLLRRLHIKIYLLRNPPMLDPAKKIIIVIPDDHKLLREMWIRIFAGNQELEVVGESGEFNEAYQNKKA